MSLRDLLDTRIGEMVVVVMGDDDCIDDRNVFDLAGCIGKALRTQQVVRPTSLLENWIKKDPKTIWEFDIIAGVSKPCSAQSRGISTRKELWLSNRNGGRSCIGDVRFAIDSAPEGRFSSIYCSEISQAEYSTHISICPTFFRLTSCHELSRKTLS